MEAFTCLHMVCTSVWLCCWRIALQSWMSAYCSCAVVIDCGCLWWTCPPSKFQAFLVGDISGINAGQGSSWMCSWSRKARATLAVWGVGTVLLKQLQGGVLLQEWHKYKLEDRILVPLFSSAKNSRIRDNALVDTVKVCSSSDTHASIQLANSPDSVRFSQSWHEDTDNNVAHTLFCVL